MLYMVDLYSELQKAVETPLSVRLKQLEFFLTITENHGELWDEFNKNIDFIIGKNPVDGSSYIGVDRNTQKPMYRCWIINNTVGLLAGWKITKINRDRIDGVKIKQQKKKEKK